MLTLIYKTYKANVNPDVRVRVRVRLESTCRPRFGVRVEVLVRVRGLFIITLLE